MNQRNNILQELNELGSTLGNVTPQNIYVVPDGYFEELANHLLNRVKAIEANDPGVELSYLSPLLNSVSKTNPYTVPNGYFEELGERLQFIKEDYQDAKDELAAISPLLSSLNKQNVYSLPSGYFDTLDTKTNTESVEETPKPKVVPILSRQWFRYAAAAILVGVVASSALIFEAKRASVDPNKNPDEWVAKNIKKVSTDKLDDFIKLADEETSSADDVNNKDEKTEIKDLMKDVPENQIQDFLNETSALPNGDNSSHMN